MAMLQRETKSVVRELDRNGDECILSVREKPAAVLMSLARYEILRTLEDMKRREEDEILEVVARGDREYEEGRTIKASSMAKLRS